MIHILVFTEGKFADVFSRRNVEVAKAFANGLMTGAHLYGSGNCMPYLMPDDEAEMRTTEKAEEVELALVRMRLLETARAK